MLRATQMTLTRLILALVLSASGLAAHAQNAPTPVFATENPDLYRMLGAMGMYDVLGIMVTESTNAAADIEAQMFPDAGGQAWQDQITQLYAPVRMMFLFEGAFPQDALSPSDLTTLTDFALSDVGRRIIAGEVATRRIFLEEDAVEAAIAAFETAVEAGDPRLDILARYNDVNGLVERNVTGALNLRFTFYSGLADGGAFAQMIPEETLLAQVWALEPDVRRTTVEWLFAFQLLAYQDITDAELEAYVSLSNTPAGRAVNAALFAAINAMLAELTYDVGTAAAGFIAGEDI